MPSPAQAPGTTLVRHHGRQVKFFHEAAQLCGLRGTARPRGTATGVGNRDLALKPFALGQQQIEKTLKICIHDFKS